jgi:exportin-2 (importin alpha re-exporter)
MQPHCPGGSLTSAQSLVVNIKCLTGCAAPEAGLLCSPPAAAALADYAANPSVNWRSKDLAVYMVTALSIKASEGVKAC